MRNEFGPLFSLSLSAADYAAGLPPTEPAHYQCSIKRVFLFLVGQAGGPACHSRAGETPAPTCFLHECYLFDETLVSHKTKFPNSGNTPAEDINH
jgi:hypothetical protein